MIEMIQDDELRELFQIESEEHVQIIEKCLLVLEKNPKDYETLHLVFREAHSMKGASRMLGISDIESIAHIFEESLGKASNGEFDITSNSIDVLYEGLDAIRKLVSEAVTGNPSDVDVVTILDKLLAMKAENSVKKTIPVQAQTRETSKEEVKISPKANQLVPVEPIAETPKRDIVNRTLDDRRIEERRNEAVVESTEEIPISEIVKTEPVKSVAPTEVKVPTEIDKIIESKKASIVNIPDTVIKKETDESKKANTKEIAKVDTMRVEPSKLDSLMVQAGELIVTKNRILNRVKEVGEVQYFQEDTFRTLQDTKRLLAELAKESEKNTKVKFLVGQFQDVLAKQSDKFEHLLVSLNNLKNSLSHDVTRLSHTSLKIERNIYNIRMLSLSSVFNLFHRTIRDLSRETGKNIQLIIEGGETTVDKQILEELKDPLMHVIRNAVDHGIESREEREISGKPEQATIYLIGKNSSDKVIIEIRDDGKGINIEKVKSRALEKGLYTSEQLALMDERSVFSILFHHGFSTQVEVSNLSGRGVGMDVVKGFVEKFKGDIDTDSELGKGTSFKLRLPTKFSTTNILIFSVLTQKYGIPTDNIILAKTIYPQNIFTIEGKSSVMIEGEPVYLAHLYNYLELGENRHSISAPTPCILIKSNNMKIAILVDSVIEKNEVIVKIIDGILKRVRNVSGVTILDSGEICIVLNPRDLVESILNKNILSVNKVAIIQKNKILVVDDSLTTRVQIKRILESEGYLVELAYDGQDGWEKVSNQKFDCMITDLEMPRLDGLGLTRKVKGSQHKDLPIIMLTSLGSSEQIQSGMDAGVNTYLVKSKFDRNDLLDIVKRHL
jgi:two-component system, chemotaxis family, sensor kinase CheA